MLGKFQKSELRIEVKADSSTIGQSLMEKKQLQKWFLPLQFTKSNSSILKEGDTFTCNFGLFEVKNQVQIINSNCFRLILSGGIDGYQEWCWGDGWVQSRLEGVSLLPLNLSQTFNLLRLRNWLAMINNEKHRNEEENNDNENKSIEKITEIEID